MFYVINKSKIYSYIIALGTVVILFFIAGGIDNNSISANDIIETSSNIVENVNEIENNNLTVNE